MGIAHYYLGEYQTAESYLTGVCRYISGLTDNVLKRQWHVFWVLNKIKLFEAGLLYGSQEELMAQAAPFIQKVEQWAELGPLLRPYLAFLHAEVERVTGSFRAARGLYLDALDVAGQNGYTFLQGFINEGLGDMLLQAGQRLGTIYLAEAARLYQEAKASRKEQILLASYPDLLERKALPLDLRPPSPVGLLPDLSAEYLMKSALAISSEIEQNDLLKKIMDVVIESSGHNKAAS